jgi:hypothetical protein
MGVFLRTYYGKLLKQPTTLWKNTTRLNGGDKCFILYPQSLMETTVRNGTDKCFILYPQSLMSRSQ